MPGFTAFSLVTTMLKISFKGFDKAERDTKAKINAAIRNPEFLNKVGDKFVKNLQQNLLQGRDPGTARPHENQLEQSTVDRREKIAKYNITDEFYKPKRPLVYTGKLVRSLAFKIAKTIPVITIIAEGMHPPYRGKGGRKIGPAIKNQSLLEFHHFGDGQKVRKLVGLSAQGAKSLVVEARNAIRRLLLK